MLLLSIAGISFSNQQIRVYLFKIGLCSCFRLARCEKLKMSQKNSKNSRQKYKN